MTDVCRAMGVRTGVPFSELTEREREIVFHGPAEKRHILYRSKKGDDFAELDFTYFNAVYTVENALSKVKDDKGMKRVEKFLKQDVCPDCGGSRLSEKARAPRLRGLTLGEATPILSGGEAQRLKLASEMGRQQEETVFVFDEPTIGLHPLDVRKLLGIFEHLTAHGATVVVIEHDLDVIAGADYLIDMGPGGGEAGGRIVAAGTVEELCGNLESVTGQYLKRRLER